MAFSNFTFAKLKRLYGIEENSTQTIFEYINLPNFEISAHLLQDIEEGKRMPILTEKAKSENIIAPIMRELKRKNPNISIFSGFALFVEDDKELSGNPDFILSSKPGLVEVKSPIFCLMESKNKMPEEGFAQCAAEMYAARLLNEKANEPLEIIYGAVTNAFEWIFMKLEGNTVFIDTNRYYLNELNILMQIFQYIVNQGKTKNS